MLVTGRKRLFVIATLSAIAVGWISVWDRIEVAVGKQGLRLWLYLACTFGVVLFAVVTEWEERRKRARSRGLVDGYETLAGKIGTVVEPLSPQGKIKIQGEIWDARGVSGALVQSGEHGRVVGCSRQYLEVEVIVDEDA